MKTSLEEMLAFVSVVDSGPISRAAEQLEQTASGVSRALVEVLASRITCFLDFLCAQLKR